MHRYSLLLTTVTFVLAWLPVRGLAIEPAPGAAEPSPEAIRRAIDKALPTLVAGAEGHTDQKTCFACHNQTLPILAMTTVRSRGIVSPSLDLAHQAEFIAEFLDRNRENYRKGKGQGGQADTAVHALLALELAEAKPGETTSAVVEYLLQRDQEKRHWRANGQRPPTQGSSFSTTYLALRALQRWGAEKERDRIAARIDDARQWLRDMPANDTEDRVFRLRGLREVNADAADVKRAADQLAAAQRPDGGWAQTDGAESDAYATGSALAALHEAGGLSSADPVYRRGLAFLLATQRDDGTWLVKTRAKPIQPYYESGFPHGKDQFISIAATSWATVALAHALPPAAAHAASP